MSLPPGQKSSHEPISDLQGGSKDKRELRREMIRARLALDETTRAQWDAAIGARLMELLLERRAKSLGVFWPFRNEPDLLGMYEKLAEQGVPMSLPIVVAKGKPLNFVAWKPGDEMMPEAFGILVPRHKVPVMLPEIVLVPCVGFDTARYRLGYGGGFFDRTLSTYLRPYAIGVAYSFQEMSFPVDEFDAPLDCIVTENGLLR